MRSLLPVILVGSAALLAACNPAKQATSGAGAAANVAAVASKGVDLWSIQTLDETGQVTGTKLICADERVRDSFARPMPSPNDQPCALIGQTVETPAIPGETPGRFSARCRSPDGRFLNIQASTTGDRERDFSTRLLIQAAAQGGRQDLVHTLHFRKVGACPSDWTIGDAAAPGDTKVVNSLTGAQRQVATPAAPPAQ